MNKEEPPKQKRQPTEDETLWIGMALNLEIRKNAPALGDRGAFKVAIRKLNIPEDEAIWVLRNHPGLMKKKIEEQKELWKTKQKQ